MNNVIECPFCGGPAFPFKMDATAGYVECKLCGCRTKLFHTSKKETWLEKAVKVWNRRSPVDNAITKLQTEKEAALEDYEMAQDQFHLEGAVNMVEAFERSIQVLRELGGEK